MKLFSRLVVLLVAVFLCVQTSLAEPARATVRVGLWTLWRDREVAVAAARSTATVKLCATCSAERLIDGSAKMDRAGLLWISSGHTRIVSEIDFAGGLKLKAHGETVVLAWPVRVRSAHGVLEIVATVPVERYVEMAVAAESGPADSEESRKALAVVARSFALDHTERHAGFDVCDSTHCQWVRWRSSAEAHAATLATAGESLWLKGARMGAYFHQNCGGRTAAASEIWPGRAEQAGLLSIADPYCVRMGSSDWSAQMTLGELTEALAREGLAAPGWKTLRVVERGGSGRAMVVDVGGTRIPAESFRLAVGRTLGWDRIRSDWFEVSAAGDGFVFHGRGTGHGVGLCQAGAAEMAREGRGYREILAQYFPTAQIADVATGRPWQRIVAKGFILETNVRDDAQFVPELSHALEAAESRSGLHSGGTLTVRAYGSTPAFRDATLAPGWVAAFTEGDRIALQPLRVLAGRKLLFSTALHEFLHVLVEEQATMATPLWLREGLVEALAGEAASGPRPAITPEQANRELAAARTEAESVAAHRAAGWYVRRLLDRYGRGQVIEWLRAGPPQALVDLLR
jgi:stage II sporulation protein D